MRSMLILGALALASLHLMAAAPPSVTAHSLLADLAGPDDVAQSRARQLLPREGVEIADDLCALLSHPDQRVWHAAINCIADLAHSVGTLGREKEQKIVADALMAVLHEDTPLEVKERVLKLVPVVLQDKYDLKPLAALLDAPDTRERTRVALRELGSSSAVQLLSSRISKADDTFRIALIDALSSIGTDTARNALQPLTRHRDEEARAAALRGIATSGYLSLASLMRSVLKKAPEGQTLPVEDAWLRWLEAAGQKGGNVEILMGLYEELLSTSMHEVIQGGVLSGLARFGDERAAAKLTAMLQAETPLAPQALYGLRMQQGRAAETILRDAYASIFPAYRAQYLTQLTNRHSVAFIETYKLAAADADPAVKRAALSGLALSGSPDAIGPMKEIAADPTLAAEVATSIGAIASQLAAAGNRGAAGRAWLAVHEVAQTDEQRTAAIEGVKSNPVPEAATLLAEVLDDSALAALPVGTLAEIIPTMSAAGLTDRAAALEAALQGKLGEPGAIDQIIQFAERTGQQDAWRGRLGFVREWQVVGPFPFSMAEGFASHIGEPNVDVAAEYPNEDPNAAPLKWQPFQAGGLFAHISLMGPLGEPEHACAYALANVVLDADTECVLGLGSDDGIRAWVNGTQVHENNTDRGVAIDSDKIPVSLKAGVNAILLQITQNGGGWGFVARLSRAEGAPLAFTQSAPPAAEPASAPSPEVAPPAEPAPSAEVATAATEESTS